MFSSARIMLTLDNSHNPYSHNFLPRWFRCMDNSHILLNWRNFFASFCANCIGSTNFTVSTVSTKSFVHHFVSLKDGEPLPEKPEIKPSIFETRASLSKKFKFCHSFQPLIWHMKLHVSLGFVALKLIHYLFSTSTNSQRILIFMNWLYYWL